MQDMQYIEVVAPGGPENMKVARGPQPTLREGEVLIEVHAAGLNRPDLMQRKGLYPPPPDASPLLGLEVAGRIAALHDDERVRNSKFQIGDDVCALTPGGGYAEFVAVPVEQCLPKPVSLSFEEAAGVPENHFTVWSNVFRDAQLQPGESLLVHGGTSGIGTTAIQMACALDSAVFATAGSDRKCQSCLSLGATAAINYKTQDFEAEIKRLTSGHGVDVILDMVGGTYTAKNLRSLARRGRLTQIAVQQGAEVSLNLLTIMQKRLLVMGSTLRPMPVADKGRIRDDLREKIWPLLEARKIRVAVDRIFPFAEVAAAHAYLEKGDHIGKVLLKVK